MRPQRGIALAMTLMVAALIAVLLSGAVTSTLFGRQVSDRFRARRVASEAARAGLDTALWHLSRNAEPKDFVQTLPRSGATVRVEIEPGPAGCLHLVSRGEADGQSAVAEAIVDVSRKRGKRREGEKTEVVARWGE